MADRVIEELDENECRYLISPGGVGRVSFTGWSGPTVLPVNYIVHDGTVVFRTAEHGPLDEDLRSGISNADLIVAFEVDEIDMAQRRGWSVVIQGPAHHIAWGEQDPVRESDIETWAPGERDLFVRVTPSRITGRRVGRPD